MKNLRSLFSLLNFSVRAREGLRQQVRSRIMATGSSIGSNVMKYGDTKSSRVMSKASSIGSRYMCTNVGTHPGKYGEHNSSLKADPKRSYAQGDCDLLYFQEEYRHAPEGSEKKAKAWEQYQTVLQQRRYVDETFDLIGEFLFGTTEKASTVMKAVRVDGQPFIRDWNSYMTMLKTYQKICGRFTPYGLSKHALSLVNLSNAGVKPESLVEAAEYARSTLSKRGLQYVSY